jgi:hypothetical protein
MIFLWLLRMMLMHLCRKEIGEVYVWGGSRRVAAAIDNAKVAVLEPSRFRVWLESMLKRVKNRR